MRAAALLVVVAMATTGSGQSLLGGALGGGGGTGNSSPLLSLLSLASPKSIEGLLNTAPVHHPRDFEPRFFGGLHVGFQMADVVGGSLPEERAIPWVGARFEGGGALTYRDRIGASLGVGWGIAGYLLWPEDSVCYDIYHTSRTVETRLWWIPRHRNSADRQVRIGLGMGLTLQRDAVLERHEDGITATTTATRMARPFLAPELGLIGAEGKDRMELGLRYVAHLDRTPAWTSIARNAVGDAVYQGKDDQLALVMRYHIGFKRKRPQPVPVPASVLASHASDTLVVLDTRQERITLRLWDNAEYDGDTISVLLNGRPILVAFELTRKPHRLTVDLENGVNELRVVAHNEGRVPPNTASCTVRRGKGREELLIRTAVQRDQQIIILKH